MIRINLLPARVSRRNLAGRQQVLVIGVALLVAFGGNLAWSRIRNSALERGERRLRDTRDAIVKLDRIIGEVKTIKAQQAAVKDKLAVLEKLKAGRQGPVRVLDELATMIPKKLWLRKVEEKSGAVVFDGSAASIDEVSAFLTALKTSRHFTTPELRKTTARHDKGLKLVDFTITADVNYTPALAPIASAVAVPERR